MKRLHIHISVDDLDASRRFYSTLFGMEPTKVKHDYLQWLVDDPAVNFAISLGKAKTGLNHLGLQFEDGDALSAVEKRLHDAGIAAEKQHEAKCCYAASDKVWVQDPQSVLWENYHTTGQIELFGGDAFTGGTGCCAPNVSENGRWSTGASC